MKRYCVIDQAIGETRAAVFEGSKPVELFVHRDSNRDRPVAGDRFAGRVRHIEKSLGAAFIDLGCQPDGFLKFTNSPQAPRLAEGLRIEVDVIREAEDGKGPLVQYIQLAPDSRPGRISGQSLPAFIQARYPGIELKDAPIDQWLEAVDEHVSLPGGGAITIEKTRALWAIDIDSGTSASPFNVAKAAMPIIAAQLRLRGIGGLICIDVPNLRQRRQRDEIFSALEAACEPDPNIIKVAPMSRFGVIEMTRSRTGRSLDEILKDPSGEFSVETMALEAFRRLEREGRLNPGAKLTATVTQNVYDWMLQTDLDWRQDLTDKLGARFEFEVGVRFDVRGDR